MTAPGSRTWLCRVDGTHDTGDIIPNNAACTDAIAQGGKQPLWDWFGVLRADGAGRTRGYIPDGQLCSGGNDTYSGYDQARADWPYTSLTAGAEIRLAYNAWAPHPGEFRLHVTKEGYDPNQPLTWDDLEEQPFTTYSAETPNATDQVNQTPEYAWTATLPARSGPHVIYSIWQRFDSDETFYGCSDVRFDGGSGEVVGIGPAGAQTLADLAPAAPGVDQPSATTVPGQPTADESSSTMAPGQPAAEQSPSTAVPGQPAAEQPALAEPAVAPPVAAGSEANAVVPAPTTAGAGIGLGAVMAIGLGGVLLGVLGSVAGWALIELRRAHRKLARFEAASPSGFEQDAYRPIDRLGRADDPAATAETDAADGPSTAEFELQTSHN